MRFGEFALAQDPQAYLRADLQRTGVNDASFTALYNQMQTTGAQVFETYNGDRDSVNRQVKAANPQEMAQLQRADRFT